MRFSKSTAKCLRAFVGNDYQNGGSLQNQQFRSWRDEIGRRVSKISPIESIHLQLTALAVDKHPALDRPA